MSNSWNREGVAESLFVLSLTAIFGYALIKAGSWSLDAALFPLLIATPGLLLAILVYVLTLLRARRTDGSIPSSRSGHNADLLLDQELMSGSALVRTSAVFAWIFGLLLAVWLLGQKLALPLFVFLYLKTSREKWILSILLTLATVVFLLGIFDRVIQIAWHEGVLFEWLGWDPL